MQYLITTSGFTLVPPSGLTIVIKSLQLDTIVSSGSIRVSGSTTFNDILTAISPVVIDMPFKQGENVVVTPVSGTAIINYIYGGEPEAYQYGRQASEYSLWPSQQKWTPVVQSGSYQTGFGG